METYYGLQIAGIGYRKFCATWFFRAFRFTHFFNGLEFVGMVQTNAIISLEKFQMINQGVVK